MQDLSLNCRCSFHAYLLDSLINFETETLFWILSTEGDRLPGKFLNEIFKISQMFLWDRNYFWRSLLLTFISWEGDLKLFLKQQRLQLKCSSHQIQTIFCRFVTVVLFVSHKKQHLRQSWSLSETTEESTKLWKQ